MKKKFVAFALCLLSVAGCASQQLAAAASSAEEQDTEASTTEGQEAVSEDYLKGISGTYVELFPELSKEEYRDIWIDAVTPLAGEENAETTTDMLLGMCMAEVYGPEAAEKYEADPGSMAFDCYFLGGVDKFVMDGDTITGLDERDRRYSLTPISSWRKRMKMTSFSTRAKMQIRVNLPILHSHRIRWKPRIIWNSATQRSSRICRAGLREITPTGMRQPSQRITIRKRCRM